MIPFVHLHVHSQYSVLDGQAAVEKLVDKAIADGMRGMALTDHGNMYGIKELHDYCNRKNGDYKDEIKMLNKSIDAERVKESPDAAIIAQLETRVKEAESKMFKPIFGCEVYVADTVKEEHVDKRDIGRHLILLAKNYHGYKNLIKIVSRAWTDGFYSHPRTDKADIEKYHEDIICCSACLGGEVPRLILSGQLDKAREVVDWFKGVFGDDYYIELQRHKATVAKANHETYERQVEVNEELIKIAREKNIKLICTNDVHFVNESDADAHERLLCVSTGRTIDDPNLMLYSKQEWFKTTAEMNEVFGDIPESLQNTNEILDFPLPDGFTDEDDYLRYLVYEGAKERWGEDLDAEHRERLDFELETIKTMGFPGYFLIVQDYIRVAPSLGVSVGPGRGSAAGSAVAYCLGITKIDPIKYDLLFERFLNPDRISLPDIDVDFDDDGRAKILKYVTDKYGSEKVAHIITYGTMAAKMAIKDVARAEGLSIDESNRLAAFVPSKPNDMPDDEKGKKYKISISNCLKCFPEFAREKSNPNPLIADTVKYAEMLEGNVRSTGVHACGVIISRDDITDWVPVSTASDKDGRLIVTQYEGSVIESTGLIKMDFLGLKTLSIIADALANIKINYGIDLDIDKIPIADPKTYRLYCEGRTTGTFQFESPNMQKYLIELQPSTFEDLIAMNALYRPGPMDNIPQFIARKKGEEPIKYDIPCMEKYLKDTYGITVYQEQVMLLSRQLADFTRGQSDTLRKAMGKKQIEKMNHLEGLFYKGGEKNGYDRATLSKIWEDRKKFASYAFNKSHATCYSWVAYQTAYLKANYPAEYMAAVLSRNSGDVDKLTKFMEECRSMGIDVKGPDINESFKSFSANKNGYIRYGLGGIKGVGSNAVDAVIEERNKNGVFKDIYDVVERINLGSFNRRTIDSMALAGAFDCFGQIKREDFFEKNNKNESFSEVLVKFGQRFQAGSSSMQNSLFGALEPIEVAKPPIPRAEQWSTMERLSKERELVGMYLSAHPLDEYKVEMDYGCTTTLAQLDDNRQWLDKPLTCGGLVVESHNGTTKKGNPCVRFKVEDYSGSYEFALYDRDFLDYGKFGQVGLAIIIQGAFVKPYDRVRFRISSIKMLSEMKGKMVRNIIIDLPDSEFEKMNVLKDHVENPGKITRKHEEATRGLCDLFFNVVDTQTQRHVQLRAKGKIRFDKKVIDNLKERNYNFTVIV